MTNIANIDLEYQFLAAIVTDPFVCDTNLINPDIFTAPIRRDVLQIINKVIRPLGGSDGAGILGQELDKLGYTSAEYAGLISEIAGNFVPVWYWDRLLDELNKLHKRRVQLAVAEKIAKKAIDGTDGDFDALRDYLATVENSGQVVKTYHTMAEVAAMRFDPIPFIVDGIIPPGLTFIAGRPKAGKSWLALQLLSAVSNGDQFIGRATRPVNCCYIALEDSLRRLSGRINKQGLNASNKVKIVLQDNYNGLDKVKRLLLDFDLIVIDTFTRATGADQVDPVAMRNLLGPLQYAAMGLNKAVVVIDHMPKGRGGDNLGSVINDLYGSIIKAGVADCVVGLYRDDGSGTLTGTGRDIQDFDIALQWDENTCTWAASGGIVDRLGYSENRLAVLSAIVEGDDGISTLDLSAVTGINKGTVSRTLQELLSAGYVVKFVDGKRILYQPSIVGKQDILPQWDQRSAGAGAILQGRLA